MRIRLLAIVALATGCARGAPPSSPEPAPAPQPAPLPAPIPSISIDTYHAQYCVLRNGRLESVELQIFSATSGDSTYQGNPIARAFPIDSTYALNASWYTGHEPLSLPADRYIKYGLPRVLEPTDVIPVADFRGVTVFAEPMANRERPEVVYLPVRPGCEFQPYVRNGPK